MKLYKYTTINDNLFDMLIKEYFYCSNAIHFDDVFDGKMPFENISKDKITDLEIKNILDEEIQNLVSVRGKINCSESNEIKIDLNTPIEESYEDYEDYMANLEPCPEELEMAATISNASTILFSKENFEKIKKFILYLIEKQNKMKICCFTKNVDNQVLWSMYANQFDGVCIEYEINDSETKFFHDVFYGSRFDYDPLYYLINCILNKKEVKEQDVYDIANKLMLCKNNDWSFQKEVRYFSKQNIRPCKISCLYIGYKVSKKYEELLTKIVNDKFPIRRMVVDCWNQTYKFRTINQHYV